MENSITIEMKPTNETLSLLRLIISYFSQTLDFNVDDIDNMKELLTKINYILNPNWTKQNKIKIEIDFNSSELNTIIYCNLDGDEKRNLEKCCQSIKYPTILNENIRLKEITNNEVAIFIKLAKRDANG